MDTTWYLQYTSGLEHRSLRTRLATAPQARSSHPQEITCLQPAVVPSLSVNWVYVLPVVIDAISQAPHMPVPALWRGQPIYIPLQCREHVLADKQSQQSFWWGGDEKIRIWTKFDNNSHARHISWKIVLTSKVWDGIKYPPHWVFVTVPLQSRSDFTSLCGGSLILMRVFFLCERRYFSSIITQSGKVREIRLSWN